MVVLIAFGTVVYRHLENWDWISSFYFAVTTLTTVGYGDLYPTTNASRLFTAFFILAGVSVVLASLSVIGSDYLSKRRMGFLRRLEKSARK